MPILLLLTFLLFSCRASMDYFDYISELRSNIFLAAHEDFSLKIYAVQKESPYAMDGLVHECFPRIEAYLVAPAGNEKVTLQFQIDGQNYGGEMSYDSIRGEYYYYHSLDISQKKELVCNFTYGKEKFSLTAKSVLTETTLSPRHILDSLYAEYPAPFAALTDEYGFAGEIYLRLIYEESPYYYIGIINREGKVYAFLLNAETGKILARREG